MNESVQMVFSGRRKRVRRQIADRRKNWNPTKWSDQQWEMEMECGRRRNRTDQRVANHDRRVGPIDQRLGSPNRRTGKIDRRKTPTEEVVVTRPDLPGVESLRVERFRRGTREIPEGAGPAYYRAHKDTSILPTPKDTVLPRMPRHSDDSDPFGFKAFMKWIKGLSGNQESPPDDRPTPPKAA